jgi:hypothetical protein
MAHHILGRSFLGLEALYQWHTRISEQRVNTNEINVRVQSLPGVYPDVFSF